MRLGLSIASESRQFSRMMRRIRPRIQSLLDAFGEIELQHPIHEAILVQVVSSLPPELRFVAGLSLELLLVCRQISESSFPRALSARTRRPKQRRLRMTRGANQCERTYHPNSSTLEIDAASNRAPWEQSFDAPSVSLL